MNEVLKAMHEKANEHFADKATASKERFDNSPERLLLRAIEILVQKVELSPEEADAVSAFFPEFDPDIEYPEGFKVKITDGSGNAQVGLAADVIDSARPIILKG